MGIIGNFRGDFSDSIENEWLCAQIIRGFGLPIAETAMLRFGDQKVLAVTRFDRRWVGPDDWIVRLPQEDFCQATGRASTEKYQADGGPSIEEILAILAGSESAEADQTNFLLAQLSFWLLAATDGHGKNFSIHHRAGAAFGMTPFYDVLSAWPVIGTHANELAIQDAKLAMAIRSKQNHYRIREIFPRHWHGLATRAGIPGLWKRMRDLVESAESIMEKMTTDLPANFPERVIEKISAGMRQQAHSFLLSAPAA